MRLPPACSATVSSALARAVMALAASVGTSDRHPRIGIGHGGRKLTGRAGFGDLGRRQAFCLRKTFAPCGRICGAHSACNSGPAYLLGRAGIFGLRTQRHSTPSWSHSPPATHTSSPVAAINATRPPALMVIVSLPTCPASRRKKRPCCVFSARQKMGIFWQDRAKSRQRNSTKRGACARAFPVPSTRCDRPAIDVMSLIGGPTRRPAVSFRRPALLGPPACDHDFVIRGRRCNKLKDRPNCQVERACANVRTNGPA